MHDFAVLIAYVQHARAAKQAGIALLAAALGKEAGLVERNRPAFLLLRAGEHPRGKATPERLSLIHI